LCGAFASGALLQGSALQPALTALVLAGAWQVLWAAIAHTHWQPARNAWRSWSHGTPLRHLPYTQAGSDADQVSQDLGQFMAWLRAWLMPRFGGLLLMAAAAGLVALALATGLGVPAVLLTVIVAMLIQVVLALSAGNGAVPAWADGLAVIGLPFALGLSALGAPAAWPVALACAAMGIAWMALKAGHTALLHAGSAAAIALFVLLREPAPAFVLGVLWATGALLRPAGHRVALVLLGLAGVAIGIML
jgi:hypothetical protein